VIVLVEGFGPDAIGLARFLAAEGETVRIAAPEPEPREATELRRLGIAVEPNANLDASPGPADVAYVDPWTPETADRIERTAVRRQRRKQLVKRLAVHLLKFAILRAGPVNSRICIPVPARSTI